jgi:hypothetical protein
MAEGGGGGGAGTGGGRFGVEAKSRFARSSKLISSVSCLLQVRGWRESWSFRRNLLSLLLLIRSTSCCFYHPSESFVHTLCIPTANSYLSPRSRRLSPLLISLPVNMPSRKSKRLPCPLPPPSKPLLALGLEGSANKLGVGLILHSPPSSASPSSPSPLGDPGTVSILSNIRHTYVTPPGEGFLPSDTARHHKRWIGEVVEKALKEGGKTMEDVDVVCFTKGTYLRTFLSLEES